MDNTLLGQNCITLTSLVQIHGEIIYLLMNWKMSYFWSNQRMGIRFCCRQIIAFSSGMTSNRELSREPTLTLISHSETQRQVFAGLVSPGADSDLIVETNQVSNW